MTIRPIELPPLFLERQRSLLGDEFPAFLNAYTHPARLGLRLNLLKLSPETFLSLSAAAAFGLAPVAWCPEGYHLNTLESAPGKQPYHAAGLYYLQEPSAMLPAVLLDPRPGERILDLAAAPGGKSTQLAARLGGDGLLIANEIHPKRAGELAQNLERWGAVNAAILQESPPRLAEHFGAWFDGVLLDAPCSGEGIFRKNPLARREWSLEHVNACAARQGQILQQAAALVRPGGWMVYATCTFAPEENEAALAAFLRLQPDFALKDVGIPPGWSPGRGEWAGPAGAGLPLERSLRLWPQRAPGEGHFVAVVERLSGGDPPPRPPFRPALPSPAQFAYLQAFAAETLTVEFARGEMHLAGETVYRLPAGLPGLSGLRVFRPGWRVGTLKTGRFEPAHALALGLNAGQARQRLDLTPEEAVAYLKGRPLPAAGLGAGWVLVCVDGYPLGWGKSTGGVVKNYYPRGLRRM